jgi:hypothetical protein
MPLHTTLACPLPVSNARLWETYAETYAESMPKFQPFSWVKLRHPPTAFSFDEAWLLCECGDNEWLAWIPDYGEWVVRSTEICVA